MLRPWKFFGVEIDYLRPAVAGDTLEVTTWLKEMRGSRAVRCYEIRIRYQDDLLVKAEVLWVWVEASTMRPRPIPSVLLEGFLQEIERKDGARSATTAPRREE